MYDYGARNYDPAIGRWTSIDLVTHFNQSVYTAFDNNPVYFADPSGTETVSSITDAWNQTPAGQNSTWYNNGNGRFTDDAPKEGEIREERVNLGTSYLPDYQNISKFYHAGGVEGSEAGWYTVKDYFENFRTTIRRIGQGQASINVLGSFNFTNDVLIAMYAWAAEAYAQYGGKPRMPNGNIEAMEFRSPIFILASFIPSAARNSLIGARVNIVKINTELISSDVLLIEKKFLEKALAEDYAQLENGRNQMARELNQGHTPNPHGLADEVNRVLPNNIRFKEEAIRKINETLKK